jgi:hypothetical protein
MVDLGLIRSGAAFEARISSAETNNSDSAIAAELNAIKNKKINFIVARW